MQRRFSLFGKAGKVRKRNPQLLHQSVIAAIIADTVHYGRHASAGKGFKIRRLGIGICAHGTKNRFCKGMLRAAFQGGGNLHQAALPCPARQNVRHSGATSGEGAGLVQNHGVNPVQIFQRLGIFEQYPHLSAPTGAHHDCYRRGQSQGAGAGNYQNGYGVG